MTEPSELEQLRAELRELREEVRRLQQERHAPRGKDRATRRGVLAMAAGGALGATLAAGTPAEAGNGDPLIAGSVFNTASGATGIAITGSGAGYGIGVTDNGLSDFPAFTPALFGHAKGGSFSSGVLGYVDPAGDGSAVSARNDASGAAAEICDFIGNALFAEAGGPEGVGVAAYGRAGDGVYGRGGTAGAGVHGVAIHGTNPAVWADAQTGGTGPGLKATSVAGRGIVASGKVAPLQLKPSKSASRPTRGETGDLFVDKTGRLWFCQVGGATATWKQIA
jgi:hypothetical protein